ncbi:hypothetical protein pb186bvf_020520 [Paramecium bursaria]
MSSFICSIIYLLLFLYKLQKFSIIFQFPSEKIWGTGCQPQLKIIRLYNFSNTRSNMCFHFNKLSMTAVKIVRLQKQIQIIKKLLQSKLIRSSIQQELFLLYSKVKIDNQYNLQNSKKWIIIQINLEVRNQRYHNLQNLQLQVQFEKKVYKVFYLLFVHNIHSFLISYLEQYSCIQASVQRITKLQATKVRACILLDTQSDINLITYLSLNYVEFKRAIINYGPQNTQCQLFLTDLNIISSDLNQEIILIITEADYKGFIQLKQIRAKIMLSMTLTITSIKNIIIINPFQYFDHHGPNSLHKFVQGLCQFQSSLNLEILIPILSLTWCIQQVLYPFTILKILVARLYPYLEL